jgi:hypothetical protein
VSSRTALAVALLLAACGTTAAAQDEQREDIPDIKSIAYGDVVSDHLRADGDTLGDGSVYKMFVFNGDDGDSVTISLSSLDFNTYLLLADSVDTVLESDDDSGGKCNSQVTTVLPTTGRYILYATSAFSGKVGEFEVSVQKGMHAPPSTDPCAGFFETKGTVVMGDSVRGTLGPPDPMLGGSYYQIWDISIPVGDSATVDLKSGAFDAVLVLYRGFATALRMDDDGGGACHSRMIVEGPDYPLKVMVRSGKAEGTGEFQLRIVPEILPVVTESQCLP